MSVSDYEDGNRGCINVKKGTVKFVVESYMRQEDQAYMDNHPIWVTSLINHAFSRWNDDYQWFISDFNACSPFE